MNYLAELKAFYDRLEINPLPSPAIALWHALMSIANKTGWQQEFTAAVSVLVLKSGLNAQAVKRARNRLEQDGYITWRPRGGNQSAVYHLNSLVVQNDSVFCTTERTTNVPQSELQSVPQYEPQSEPINKQKHKQNETDSPPVSPTGSIDLFLSAYPLPEQQANRYLAETAYVDCLLTKQVTEEQLLSAAGNYAEKLRLEGREKDFRYIKKPENFLRDMTYCQYLPGVYERPERKASKADKGMMMSDYGDISELEKEILSN